jgi:hypothetical protein
MLGLQQLSYIVGLASRISLTYNVEAEESKNGFAML